jgi:multimeric flavodoxin WrbA
MTELDRKHVLGIVGSPRRGGNTEVLVGAALRGAEEAGALVEKVLLSKLDISPCLACNACRDTDECVQQDDMEELLEKMRRSQVWVLGTPVYYFGPTAQFKAFLDRWYIGRPDTFAGRRVILTIPFEDSTPETARYTVGILSDSLAWKKAELFATVLAPGVAGPGDVRKHPDIVEAAYRAGRKAIETAGS